jgi:hypothetical protein
VAHFPSCSPVVVVDVVAPVFEQRLTRLAYVLVSICLGCLELHEHVTDHLGDVSSALLVLLKGAEGEAAQPADVSWAAMQREFMEARDYSMLYLGVTLCRRQGDTTTTLATEAEVEALVCSQETGRNSSSQCSQRLNTLKRESSGYDTALCILRRGAASRTGVRALTSMSAGFALMGETLRIKPCSRECLVAYLYFCTVEGIFDGMVHA